MEPNKKELSINELEIVNGGGLITRFDNYVLPRRKRQKDESGN